MNVPRDLSDGITSIEALFEPFTVADPDCAVSIEMSGRDAARLAGQLGSLRRLAVHMEIELGHFRALEAGREIVRTAETTATGLLADMLPEIDGNVIRPNWGQRDGT